MSLKGLLKQGKLKSHKTSKKEINNLIKMIERDITDSGVKGLSNDRKFSTAYNAVLQAATILLYCEGYKAKGEGHHFITFQCVKYILGKEFNELAEYFDSCRVKRNTTDYFYAGGISEKEVKELVKEAELFFEKVTYWIKGNHPKLLDS
jgi:uncharacterized protein (UPF0332 family)